MITEWLINVGATVATWFLSLIPSWQIPDFFTTLDSQINSLFAGASGFSVWVPWTVVVTAIGISLGSWVIGLSVKAIRAIASYLPFIGGAG